MSSDSSPASWFIAHQRTILICTAALAVAVGSAAYLYSSSPSSSRRPPTPPPKTGKDKEKSKRSSKKKRRAGATDGPIIEERTPSTLSGDEKKADSLEGSASALKDSGNAAYKAGDYLKAVEFYTKAIELVQEKPQAERGKEEAVFFSNRAACYMNLKPPSYKQAISDCTSALALNPSYIKALNRRAVAYESLADSLPSGSLEDEPLDLLQKSLNDFTSSTFLQHFADVSSSNSVERVLKKLAEKTAEKVISEREQAEGGPKLPSFTFINAYFSAFRERPRLHTDDEDEGVTVEESDISGDNTLDLAYGALQAGDYIHAFTLVNEALEQGVKSKAKRAEALNLRGTFRFLLSQPSLSKIDFEESLELVPSYTQSWVKLASVWMEMGSTEKAQECFETALKHDDKDPDIWYHKGQVEFILSSFTEASQSYQKSITLDPSFIFAHIQHAVAEYKAGNISKAISLFRGVLDNREFEGRSEGWNYFGELLLDQQRFPEAIEKFDKAIELELSSSSSKKGKVPNVLPLVNKALAIYQSKQDFEEAEKLCLKALEHDPTCDAAIASLAQFNLQQASVFPSFPGSSSAPSSLERIDQAISYLEKQVELARTKEEIMGVLQYIFASKSQKEFVSQYPEEARGLGGMVRGM